MKVRREYGERIPSQHMITHRSCDLGHYHTWYTIQLTVVMADEAQTAGTSNQPSRMMPSPRFSSGATSVNRSDSIRNVALHSCARCALYLRLVIARQCNGQHRYVTAIKEARVLVHHTPRATANDFGVP